MAKKDRRSSCLSALALLLLIPTADATAATFTVTNLADSGSGSLRQAVLDANAEAGADIVAFTPGLTGTITLTSGEIAISDSLVVNGPGLGVLTLSANDLSRIFIVENPGAVVPIDVTLSGMTITRGGRLSSSGMPLPYGGAVFSHGENLTIQDSVVSDSTVTSVGLPVQRNCGGNVALLGLGGANGGMLRIVNSLLSGGRTETNGAGGNRCVELGTLDLERSALSGGNCRSRIGHGELQSDSDSGGRASGRRPQPHRNRPSTRASRGQRRRDLDAQTALGKPGDQCRQSRHCRPARDRSARLRADRWPGDRSRLGRGGAGIGRSAGGVRDRLGSPVPVALGHGISAG